VDDPTQDVTSRLNMIRQADRLIEAMARQMGVPDATAKDAARRLHLNLLRRFKTRGDAEAFSLFWRDIDLAARRALDVEIRARKRAVRRTLLAGVDDEECERILALPGVGKFARLSNRRTDLVAEYEKIRSRSFREKTDLELRAKGYNRREIALVLGVATRDVPLLKESA